MTTVAIDNVGTFFLPSIADVEAVKAQGYREKLSLPLNDKDRFGLVLARLAVFHVLGLPEGTLEPMTDRSDCAVELERATGGKAMNRVKVQPCRGAAMTLSRRDLSMNDVVIMAHIPADNRFARLVGWCWSTEVEIRGTRTSDPHYLAMAGKDLREISDLRTKAGL